MSAMSVPPRGPVFPGGMETAPEVTAGGCAHEPCLCPVEPGRTYCCPACARGGPALDRCPCGHFGCERVF
jgi:hypothetical protein